MNNEPTLSSHQTNPLTTSDAVLAREMFAEMAFIRAFEAKVVHLTRTNPPAVLGSVHLCAGQEAVPVGTLAALRHDDQVLATYRGHGWAIASDIDPTSIMAEICHRKGGLNGGRAGSAYLMAPHTRFLGETSIVGAGSTIACGVALANAYRKDGRVVVVSVGDGAMNQGAVHEAMAFAAVRDLPVIFTCENNGWSEMTPTSDMFRTETIATRGNAYGITSSTIDGTDPILVKETMLLAAKQCRSGKGPVLVECLVPRLWAHYNRDIEHYRSRADKKAAEENDPLTLMAQRLIGGGFILLEQVNKIQADQEALVDRITEAALSSPLPDLSDAATHVIGTLGQTTTSPSTETKEEEMTYIKAVNAALHAELTHDPSVVVFGEDIAKAGGIFGATRHLRQHFGADRVFDTPIAENAILGSAVGAALAGLKPIVEIMWADFLFVALDQLVNQAANVRYLTEGRSCVPIVVRTQQGATPGSCAQHSRSIEAILAHIPGLKVALAATPQDAYSLIRAAAADPDPCIVIESRELYLTKGRVRLTEAREPVGQARVHRSGNDGVIVTWGAALHRSLEAAEALAVEGISVSVLDLRWLSPLDQHTLESVIRDSSGRVVVVHEAVKTAGFGAEVAIRIQELCGDALILPVRRVTTPDVCMPASPLLRSALLPTASAIANAVRNMM